MIVILLFLEYVRFYDCNFVIDWWFILYIYYWNILLLYNYYFMFDLLEIIISVWFYLNDILFLVIWCVNLDVGLCIVFDVYI